MTHSILRFAALPVLLAVTACGGNDTAAPPPIAVPPPPPISGIQYDVSNCLNQSIPGAGTTVAGAVVPDTLTLNLAAASGFPNGRRLTDPVIDVTLAVIFLDLTRHSPAILAGLPVNPAANDLPFRSTFPYLAAAQGAPPLAATTGTAFNFRTDAESAFVQVDRMGMPAVATALVASARKTAYNDGLPVNDAAGTFVPDLSAQLTTLTNALSDDFLRLGLNLCARPRV